ncbi:MAG: hypothetical protein RSB96_02455 [Oscillospiraceae bacterium]
MCKSDPSSKSNGTRWGAIAAIVMVSAGCLCFIVSATMAVGIFGVGTTAPK